MTKKRFVHSAFPASVLLIGVLALLIYTAVAHDTEHDEEETRYKKGLFRRQQPDQLIDTGGTHVTHTPHTTHPRSSHNIPVGTACDKDVDQCLTGAQCVEITVRDYQCRSPAGQACSDVIECSPNMTCDVRTGDNGGKKCRYPAGQACSSTDECSSNMTCDARTDDGNVQKCRYSEGSTGCSTLDQNCVEGATCDDGNTCTTASPVTAAQPQTTVAPEPCTGTPSNQCPQGLICEGAVCKVKAGGSCASNPANCATGLSCYMDVCYGPFSLHHHCTTEANCGATDTGTTCFGQQADSKTCECVQATHYAHNDTKCLPRKKVDESCNIDTQEKNECIDGAECVAHNCACITDRFYEGDHKTCHARVLSGEVCTPPKECINHAVCDTNNRCQCEEHYYADGTKKCIPRTALGVSCNSADQCVEHANCDHDNVCKCNSTFYAFGGFCHPVQLLSGPCNESTPYMCLENAVCKSGRCQCNDNSFKNRTTPNRCEPTKRVNDPCDYFNDEERQCESDTKCVFRHWDPAPVCGCDIDHFFNGHACQPRALAGDPCPYDTTYTHQSTLEIHHQCVENAECSHTLICECNKDHYQRGQHCPPRISADGTCDPWANYYRQCVDNYECAHGSCVPVHRQSSAIG